MLLFLGAVVARVGRGLGLLVLDALRTAQAAHTHTDLETVDLSTAGGRRSFWWRRWTRAYARGPGGHVESQVQ
jgi:hypothetical protein